MLKSEVLEWAENRLSAAERNLEYAERKKALMIAEGETLPISTAVYSKEAEYFKIVIKAVDAFDYDEREKVKVEVMATKAPEGDAYYYELETGDRLVIRENKIEGIYSPEEKPSKWEKAFKKLVRETHCTSCPCRIVCTDKTRTIIPHEVCEENLLEYLLG